MGIKKESTRQTILRISIELFAQSGYANVSVRDIAQAVGIKPASLYYHFANKQTLYLASIEESFSLKAAVFSKVLALKEPAEIKLQHYIYALTQLASEDEAFRRLIQRELLDGDEKRMQYLAEKVFEKQFNALGNLLSEVEPNCDPIMSAISILSLVLYHLDNCTHSLFFKRP
ncbi:MAG: TetR/AcrR family transcriptional regulator [Thiohalomonas sp.]|nr:TetR/AcrR family transcriptional regulator [Thiohalomonas sp.]